MKVGELIELLSKYDSDIDVRLATQPHYPLQSSIRGVVKPQVWYETPDCEDCITERGSAGCDEDSCNHTCHYAGPDGPVYILEGNQDQQHPYGSSDWWDLV